MRARPEVVQGTAQFHDQVAAPRLPQAEPVFVEATALHTTVDMFDPEPATVNRRAVRGFPSMTYVVVLSVHLRLDWEHRHS